MINEQEHKVSYRCSLPSPLQKGSKDYKILHRSSARFFDFGKKFLRNLRNFLPSVQENSEAQNFQNLPILGSLLQWWWQWASIGHFVFLFLNRYFGQKMYFSAKIHFFCTLPQSSLGILQCLIPPILLMFSRTLNWPNQTKCSQKKKNGECSTFAGTESPAPKERVKLGQKVK